MEIRKGVGVSIGYAIGEAFVLDREQYRIVRRQLDRKDVEAETGRFRKTVEKAAAEIRGQLDAMPRRLKNAAGSILEAQIHLFQDGALNEEILADIQKNRHPAEYAASRALRKRIKTLEDNLNEANAVFIQRAVSEFTEMERRLLRDLLGAKREDLAHLTGNVILVAHDLSPDRTLSLDRSKVLGFLTEVGGPTSHTAIVARTLGIPAVVGVEGITHDVSGGDLLVVDGTNGTVIIDPDAGTRKRYEAQARNFMFQEEKLSREQRSLPAVTRDGVKVTIYANIDKPDEIPAALKHGAEGVGLYRTEFLYLEHGYSPSEKDHLETYLRAIQLAGDRRLTIRTMDIGADKMPGTASRGRRTRSWGRGRSGSAGSGRRSSGRSSGRSSRARPPGTSPSWSPWSPRSGRSSR